MKHILFLCSQNKWRSPTAEFLLKDLPGIEVRSAGTDPGAENPISSEDLEWADAIFVMEQRHRTILSKRFHAIIQNKKIVVLNIPDRYEYMDPDLIAALKRKLRPHIPSL